MCLKEETTTTQPAVTNEDRAFTAKLSIQEALEMMTFAMALVKAAESEITKMSSEIVFQPQKE